MHTCCVHTHTYIIPFWQVIRLQLNNTKAILVSHENNKTKTLNCGVGKKTLLKDCTVAVTVTVVLFCKNVKNYSTM